MPLVDLLALAFVSCIASLLTFFSGFGLGTILLPVFALWFPLDTSVALTAIVHFLNNIFKLFLVGKHANKTVIFKFGIPALLSAYAGSLLLVHLSSGPTLYEYTIGSSDYEITGVKLFISAVMIFFIFFEVVPFFKKLEFDPKYLPIGGILSGFFGGFSGHQGALRSAFLIRTGLTREGFVATGVVIACIVDTVRISIYLKNWNSSSLSDGVIPITVATVSAFVGAYVGSKTLSKLTLSNIQIIVSLGLFLLAVALGAGVI